MLWSNKICYFCKEKADNIIILPIKIPLYDSHGALLKEELNYDLIRICDKCSDKLANQIKKLEEKENEYT